MMRTISTKLFIAGLPFTFTEQQLSEMMGPCGSVLSAKIVRSSDLTGCPAALGLVVMSDPVAVRKALTALNRNPLDGQCLDAFVGESDGDSASFPEAVYALARTYADIGANDRAIEYLTQLLQQYPKKTQAPEDSRLLLAKLTRRPVDEIVASTQADGTPAAPPMKNANNGKTTPPISALVLAADRGGEK